MEVERRGWQLLEIEMPQVGKASTAARVSPPRWRAWSGKDASALVVASLDRLSRSLIDFAGLMERSSRRRGWALVALDLGVNTTSPQGEMLANVLPTFAQFERRLIGQRTRDALAEKKRQGVVLGRPRALDVAVRKGIGRMRKRPLSYRAIADALNAEGVPTAHDGRASYPATVRKVVL